MIDSTESKIPYMYCIYDEKHEWNMTGENMNVNILTPTHIPIAYQGLWVNKT